VLKNVLKENTQKTNKDFVWNVPQHVKHVQVVQHLTVLLVILEDSYYKTNVLLNVQQECTETLKLKPVINVTLHAKHVLDQVKANVSHA